MRHLRCKRGKRGTGYQPNAGPTSVECIVCVVWDQMENKSNVTLISSFNYCSCFYNNISACVHIQSIGITMCTLQCPSKKKSHLYKKCQRFNLFLSSLLELKPNVLCLYFSGQWEVTVRRNAGPRCPSTSPQGPWQLLGQ